MKKMRMIGVVGVALLIGSLSAGASWLDPAVGVSAAAALVEAHVSWLLDSMHVVTAANELKSGDWETMKSLLGQFEESTVSYNAWFLKPDGSYYKVATGLASANLSDRAYFAKVMAGETTLGDLVVSRSTGRKSMVLTAPIEIGGVVIGALGVTLYLDDFVALIVDSLDLPADLVLYAYDASGQMALHSDVELLLEDVSSAGVDSESAVSTVSELLGWTFVLGPSE
jgi:hypothetical protein